MLAQALNRKRSFAEYAAEEIEASSKEGAPNKRRYAEPSLVGNHAFHPLIRLRAEDSLQAHVHEANKAGLGFRVEAHRKLHTSMKQTSRIPR